MAGPWQDPTGSPLGAMERKGDLPPQRRNPASSVSPTEDLGRGEAQSVFRTLCFKTLIFNSPKTLDACNQEKKKTLRFKKCMITTIKSENSSCIRAHESVGLAEV